MKYRNDEENHNRVILLRKILKNNAEAVYDLPKYIYVGIQGCITDEDKRNEITKRHWTIIYDDRRDFTTIRIPQCDYMDGVIMFHLVTLAALLSTVWYAVCAVTSDIDMSKVIN